MAKIVGNGASFGRIRRRRFAPSLALAASCGSFALTGEASSFNDGFVSVQGSYALTGEAVTLLLATPLAAAFGSFTLTGEASTFADGFVSAQGSYALTGEAAPLNDGFVSAQGSYTLTGEGAPLDKGLPSAFGSFALTGEAVTFLYAIPLAAAFGSFTLTGEPASLTNGTFLTATRGNFTLTGEAAPFIFPTSLVAAKGAFTLVGGNPALPSSAAILSVGLNFPVSKGIYVLTGNAVKQTFGKITATFVPFTVKFPPITFFWKGRTPLASAGLQPFIMKNYPQLPSGVASFTNNQHANIANAIALLIQNVKAQDARLASAGL